MQKVIKFLKKYQLIIILSIIASILLVFKILLPQPSTTNSPKVSRSSGQAPTNTPNPTPTLTEKGVTQEEFLQEIVDKFPLTPFLPYPEKDYIIRYSGPLELEIISKQGKVSSKQRTKILDWINDTGVDPQTHTIEWKTAED